MTEISEMQSSQNSKKMLPVLVVGGLLALGYVLFSLINNSQLQIYWERIKQTNFSSPLNKPKIKQNETVKDNQDGTVATSYQLEADQDNQTPFELLQSSAEVEYDQYDFGVFVTSINGQTSTNDYYWAVYINGEYANEASDKIILKAGDLVEWRWEKMKAFE